MTLPEPPSDGELLRRMTRGDEEAFADLYRRHRRSVYTFAAHMSGSVAAADDVTQETFLILIRDPARFDPARGELRSFLLGVARNYVRRHAANERGTVSFEYDAETENHISRFASDDAVDPVARLVRDEDLRRLHKSIRALPAAYREAIVLCELQEMSYDEAAAIIGCAVGTVRSRLHRARRLLERKLREPQKVDTQSIAAGCLTRA